MSRLVFGVDEPPAESKERMAYIARAACGHIVIAQADSRAGSLTEFVSYGLAGLTLDRVPAQQVRDEGFCECPRPQQVGMDL
jgi:hypothetical protein